MKKILTVVLLMISAVALAQGTTDKAEVTAREEAWSKAWVDHDMAMLDSLHAEDYFAITNVGQLSTRAEIMKDLQNDQFRYTSMRHEDVVVRLYGAVAVVNGVTINQGHRGSRDVSGRFTYTRVYVKQTGGWRAVLSQYTRIPE